MEFNKGDTAPVVIDPRNDVLSEGGVSWRLVGASIGEDNTVESIGHLFEAAGGPGTRSRVAERREAERGLFPTSLAASPPRFENRGHPR